MSPSSRRSRPSSRTRGGSSRGREPSSRRSNASKTQTAKDKQPKSKDDASKNLEDVHGQLELLRAVLCLGACILPSVLPEMHHLIGASSVWAYKLFNADVFDSAPSPYLPEFFASSTCMVLFFAAHYMVHCVTRDTKVVVLVEGKRNMAVGGGGRPRGRKTVEDEESAAESAAEDKSAEEGSATTAGSKSKSSSKKSGKKKSSEKKKSAAKAGEIGLFDRMRSALRSSDDEAANESTSLLPKSSSKNSPPSGLRSQHLTRLSILLLVLIILAVLGFIIAIYCNHQAGRIKSDPNKQPLLDPAHVQIREPNLHADDLASVTPIVTSKYINGALLIYFLLLVLVSVVLYYVRKNAGVVSRLEKFNAKHVRAEERRDRFLRGRRQGAALDGASRSGSLRGSNAGGRSPRSWSGLVASTGRTNSRRFAEDDSSDADLERGRDEKGSRSLKKVGLGTKAGRGRKKSVRIAGQESLDDSVSSSSE